MLLPGEISQKVLMPRGGGGLCGGVWGTEPKSAHARGWDGGPEPKSAHAQGGGEVLSQKVLG